MPKQPPAENFRVTVTVPKPMLGEFMADCARRGLDDVHFDLVTEITTFRQKIGYGETSRLFAAWIKDHPTFKAIEVVRHFEANGLTKGSAYPILGIFVEKGILKKLGEGMYSRADVRHLAGPKKQHGLKGTKHKVFDKRGSDVILSFAKRNHGRFNSHKILELFTAQGRARNSASTSIDKLVKAKLARRVGKGQYVLLTRPTPKAAKSNGSVNNTAFVEAVTNG